MTDLSWQVLGQQALERLYEWFIGSLLIGPLLALIGGGVTYIAASGVKNDVEAA